MAPSAVAQVNVRLSRELKEAGDEGLRALDLSPTDAVRALWTRLSKGGEGLIEVRDFLLGESPSAAEAMPFEQSPVAQGWRMVEKGVAQLRITAKEQSAASESDSDNDVLAYALEERMRGRGLM